MDLGRISCARLSIGLLATACLLITACGSTGEDDTTPPPSTGTALQPTPTPPVEPPQTTSPEPTTALTGGDHSHATTSASNNSADDPTGTAVVTIPGAADTTEPTTGAGGHSSDPAEPATEADDITIEVEVAGGKPVNGVQRHRIDVGQTVTLVASGDTTDELHVHGYDLEVGFSPGQPGSITFEANIPGIFEVETHHHGDLVMELEVR